MDQNNFFKMALKGCFEGGTQLVQDKNNLILFLKLLGNEKPKSIDVGVVDNDVVDETRLILPRLTFGELQKMCFKRR